MCVNNSTRTALGPDQDAHERTRLTDRACLPQAESWVPDSLTPLSNPMILRPNCVPQPLLRGSRRLFPPPPDDRGLRRLFGDDGAPAERDFTGRAVERDPVALADLPAGEGRGALRLSDGESPASDEADLAHLPGDDRCMSGAPADCRQDPIGDGESSDVLGGGVAPDEDRGLAARSCFLRPFAGEAGAPAGDAGRGGDGFRHRLRRLGEAEGAGGSEVDLR